MMKTALATVLLLLGQQGRKWSEMDYGPFMTHSFEAKGKNIAYKGVRVRLGPDGASMVFDTDLLRWSGGWLKSSLDWKSVVYDGSHNTNPKVLGEPVFANPMTPGWAPFQDPRKRPYGPLPRGHAEFKGLYLHGERVIFSYTVGRTKVLESAALENGTLTRTLEVGPSDQDLVLQVCSGRMDVAAVGGVLERSDEHVRLRVPARGGRVKIFYGPEGAPPEDLGALMKGGPARWPDTIVTKGTPGREEGPYKVDTLPLPVANPGRSWMRPGGFDFFSDPSKAAVCTWNGDVWTVTGIEPTLEVLTWRRIATGLFQPLGLRIIKDQIFVACRDQIARLHDLNGDGETDFVEAFNRDHEVTEHFHEFAMGLQVDAEGNFYYAKAARHALPPVVPQHGTLIKVSPDGATSEIVCNGFRAPNGVGLGPNGELVASDQEGHYVPANRINLLKKGGFFGNVWSYHEGPDPKSFDAPIVWVPHTCDRSPAEQFWVTSDRWGPFQGKLISTSYGKGRVHLIPFDVQNGVPQGAIVPFPLQFPTGIMRGRFHPGDGQLYVCGLFGWAGDVTQDGGFYRVRYVGKPVRMPLDVRVTKEAVELTFTTPLDKESAENLENYSASRWNYRWTGNYGSKRYRPSNPDKVGEDEVEVLKATLRGDRTVLLALRDLGPVMQMEIAYSLKASDGAPVKDRLWLTINAR